MSFAFNIYKRGQTAVWQHRVGYGQWPQYRCYGYEQPKIPL